MLAVANEDMTTRGIAIYSRLDSLVTGYDGLIIDGAFTPPPPLLLVIARRFEAAGRPVTCLQPVVRDSWPAEITWRRAGHHVSTPGLREQNSVPATYSFVATKVAVRRFPTERDELAWIAEQVVRLIEHEKVPVHEIAVLTPNWQATRLLLREQLASLRQTEANMLLNETPTGRLVTFLYKLRDPLLQPARITIDDLIAIAGLGVLHDSKEVLECLGFIPAFVEGCRQLSDWITRVDSILTAVRGRNFDKANPLAHVRISTLNALRSFLSNLSLLSERLLNSPEGTIEQHVNHLLSVITQENSGVTPDDAFVTGIQTIQSQTRRIGPILSSAEFGRRLSEVLAIRELDVFDDRVLVTAPARVAGRPYRHVFLAQFTQDRYPEATVETWPSCIDARRTLDALSGARNPLSEKEWQNLIARSNREMFNQALQSATESLTITHSITSDNGPTSAALDLRWITKAASELGVLHPTDLQSPAASDYDHTEQSLGPGGVVEREPAPAEAPSIGPVSPAIVDIEDLAVYDLCPRRLALDWTPEFYAPFVEPVAVTLYAAACWFERAAYALAQKLKNRTSLTIATERSTSWIRRAADQCIEDVESDVTAEFPLDHSSLVNARHRAEFLLDVTVSTWLNHPVLKESREHGNSTTAFSVEFMLTGPNVVIGDARITARGLLIACIGKRGIVRTNIAAYKRFLLAEDAELAWSQLDKYKAALFNMDGGKSTLMTAIDRIRSGQWPKQPGTHCRWCPYLSLCQGGGVPHVDD